MIMLDADFLSKLGISNNTKTLLVNPTKEFIEWEKTSGGTSVFRDLNFLDENVDVILFWPSSEKELSSMVPTLSNKLNDGGKLWIIVPRKEVALAINMDFGWEHVQKEGLKVGLVDNEQLKFDEDTYGTQFVFRKN